MRILIVDDERNCRETLRDALAEDGFEVECAEEPQRAVALALETKPDILLTDLCLNSSCDGADVARAILEEVPQVRVIAMSALPPEEVNQRFASIHPVATLKKPFGIRELQEAIRQASP